VKPLFNKAQLQRIEVLKVIAKYKAKQEEPVKETFSLSGWNKRDFEKWLSKKLK
jgi:hypothetical protein